MKLLSTTAIAGLSTIALLACSAQETAVAAAPDDVKVVPAAHHEEETVDAAAILAEVNAATYDVEKTHAFLFWSVKHNGLSDYMAKFTDWDATIEFDPSDVTKSKVTASINPSSVQTDHPTKAEDWHTEISTKFFKAGQFPAITFESTAIETTGAMTGKMTGDLTFLGVTKPVTLDVTFNGVGNQPWYGERDIIGFNAETTFKRSDFGLEAMIPNISDETTIMITAEFLERAAAE